MTTYDLVLAGGTVIDPASGLHASTLPMPPGPWISRRACSEIPISFHA